MPYFHNFVLLAIAKPNLINFMYGKIPKRLNVIIAVN
jgi:hypothetical protein